MPHQKTMTPKTPTQRSKEREDRLKAQGLKMIRNLWGYREDEPAIRAHVAKINKKRERAKNGLP